MEFTTTEQKRYKQYLLQTYKFFAKFCADNEIHFCAAGGTMIGAVRHHGFIPWDDDIDVYMKRRDYDLFISSRSKLDGTEYEIIDPATNGYYCAHATLSHRNTTIWEFSSIPFVFGAYIDVFVLDYADGPYEELVGERMNYAKKINLFYICSNNYPIKGIMKHLFQGDLKKALWLLFQKLVLRNCHSAIKKQIIMHSERSHGEWLIAYTGTSGKKDIFRSKWFDSSISYPFEDTFIDVPFGYDEFLRAMYGDYMIPPSKDEQTSHHSLFYFNLDRRISKDEIEQIQIGKS